MIKFVYSGEKHKDLYKKLKDTYPSIIFFNFDFFKDRKLGYKVLGSCGARELPFCAIYNKDKTLIKAFYTEAKECTFDNINNFIINYGKSK